MHPPEDPQPQLVALLQSLFVARGIDVARLTVTVLDDRAGPPPAHPVHALVCCGAAVSGAAFRQAVNRVVTGGWVAVAVPAAPERTGDAYSRTFSEAVAAGWLRVRVQQRLAGRTAVVAHKIADLRDLARPPESTARASLKRA